MYFEDSRNKRSRCIRNNLSTICKFDVTKLPSLGRVKRRIDHGLGWPYLNAGDESSPSIIVYQRILQGTCGHLSTSSVFM